MEHRTDNPDKASQPAVTPKPDPYEGGPAAKPDPYEGGPAAKPDPFEG